MRRMRRGCCWCAGGEPEGAQGGATRQSGLTAEECDLEQRLGELAGGYAGAAGRVREERTCCGGDERVKVEYAEMREGKAASDGKIVELVECWDEERLW